MLWSDGRTLVLRMLVLFDDDDDDEVDEDGLDGLITFEIRPGQSGKSQDC